MKNILISAFVLLSITTLAQSAPKPDPSHFKIELSELEQMTIADYQEWEKQIKIKVDLFNQEVTIKRDEYQKFLKRLFDSRKIPTDRLSEKGDSLKFNASEIIGILKPLKQK